MIISTLSINIVISTPWPVWAIWLEHCPIHQKVGGSIPGQGTYWGYRFDSHSGAYKRRPIHVSLLHWCFSLSLPSSLSLKSVHIFLKIKKKKIGVSKPYFPLKETRTSWRNCWFQVWSQKCVRWAWNILSL